MHYGFRIAEDLNEGLSAYLDSKGMKSIDDLRGRSVPTLQKWENLDLHWQRVARIDYEKCIGCNLCYIACEDGAHQCIDLKSPDELGIGLGPGRFRTSPCPKFVRRTASLQPLRARLPGRRLHHDDRDQEWRGPDDMEQLSGKAFQG